MSRSEVLWGLLATCFSMPFSTTVKQLCIYAWPADIEWELQCLYKHDYYLGMVALWHQYESTSDMISRTPVSRNENTNLLIHLLLISQSHKISLNQQHSCCHFLSKVKYVVEWWKGLKCFEGCLLLAFPCHFPLQWSNFACMQDRLTLKWEPQCHHNMISN